VFSDGPGQTAERYCIEWAVLRFAPDAPCDDRQPPEYPEEE
jgi:peptide methionine sulfoxide reductase MsrB